MMPDTLPSPLPRNYGIAEGFGYLVGGRARIVRLNLRTRVARQWRKGQQVDLTSNPKAVLDEAWYRLSPIGDTFDKE